MNKQRKSSVKANESLVLNGDFRGSWTNWQRGGPLGWLSIELDSYEGKEVRLAAAGNAASIHQTLAVPKAPGDSARYILSFLCETWQAGPGRVVVEVEGQSGAYEIPLVANPAPMAQDQTQQRDAEPMDFLPIEYEHRLDDKLSFGDQDSLKISVISAPNAAGNNGRLRITRITLHVQLEPVVMQAFKLDDQTLSPTAPLPLCLGASGGVSHQLGFIPAPGNAWVGTQAALTSDDNPQGAIIATPAWGHDQPLESSWKLDCPLIGDQDPYLFTVSLLNQYTADPYDVHVSLGHHRLKFSQVREAAYYPVLELGQSVPLGIQVASFYTDQPLSGRAVTWTVAAQRISVVGDTGPDGWAWFDYQPTEAGEVEVQVSVESPYYASGTVTQTLAVRVLATDPWQEVLAVVGGTEARWDEKTGYPNRGSEYAVELRLPDVLIGTDLALHWSGDAHEQLGVGVSPALEVAVPVTGPGLNWALTCDDRLDGRFSLDLVCSKLLLSSPKKTMWLARNLVRVGDVREANKFPVVDENESVLLRVQVVHAAGRGDGDPVVDAWVDWATPEGSSATVTGDGGWASIHYTPTSAGLKELTASIKAHPEAAPVTHAFDVTAIATSPWKTMVDILLDGVTVERNSLGVLCRRGQAHTLKVVPVAGSPWIGRNISLHWRGSDPGIGLVVGDLGTAKPLIADGVQWSLVSQADTSVSSLFDLELRLAGESTVRELAGRLVAADLSEEVSLRFDQVDAALDDRPLYPCLGARHRFSVLPNALSPLVGLASRLTWAGTSAEELGATVAPALANDQPVSDGGATWTLDFTGSAEPGEFTLAWELPPLGFVTAAKPMELAHNKIRIQAWRDSAVEPVVGQDPAWVWVQVFSHFTLQSVAQVPVTWTANGTSVAATDAEGWAGFAVQASSAGTQAVTASVISPYDGYQERRSFEVTALASDPWASLAVSFDGAPPQAWGAKTYFPRRKGIHEFALEVPEDSPLREGHVTLGMTGTGPAELGITFLPEALGVARPFDEERLRYSFRVGDRKDGSFALHLASQRLASLSPANAMSLGEGVQVLEIAWDTQVDRTLEWEQELVEHITVTSSVNGRPLVGIAITWQSADLGTVHTVTDFYGVARLCFVPTTPGAAQLKVTVGSGDASRSVTRAFFLNEPRQIESLISDKPNGHPGEEVSAVARVVSAITGEPLQGVEVLWDYSGTPLAPTTTDAEGLARVTFRLTAIWRGLLEAVVKGGYAGWEVKQLEFELSAPEMDVVFDDMPVVFGGAAYPCHGATHAIRLSPTVSSRFSGMHIRLIWEGEPAEDFGAVISPPLAQAQLLTDEGVGWELDCSGTARNVEFSLRMEVVELEEVSEPLVMSLGHNWVTAERWSTIPRDSDPSKTPVPLRRKHIRATSKLLDIPAPGIQVIVQGSNSTRRTDALGEASVDEFFDDDFYLSIVNRYDGSSA